MKFRITAVLATSLALAACGSNDNASTEAEAETVEVSADEAMAPVAEEPVADPAASVTASENDTPGTVTEAEAASVETAGDNAAATAEAAMDAMGEDQAQ
ncbi:MAG: hypothetical protein CL575_06900 [Altererythrobacter sp.]|nr:hypothetical protein [Altererythrobacter sp.]MBK62653.1 hypothetical protein [Altererythrobacter sp.]|tara:strand:- start:611 stop:910 length:300 start_codon:yes stop_codon:yes gene_type:complete